MQDLYTENYKIPFPPPKKKIKEDVNKWRVERENLLILWEI